MNIPIIILAAGKSSRLGRPKQLELINGTSLLNNAIKSAVNSNVGDVLVVLGANFEKITSQLDIPNKYKVVYNQNWQNGMGSSIVAGMRQLENIVCNAVMISVCDQPFLTPNIFIKIANLYDSQLNSIITSKYDNGYGPPTLFGMDYYDQLVSLKADEGGKKIICDNMDKVKYTSFEKGTLDIDTLQDLSKLNEL